MTIKSKNPNYDRVTVSLTKKSVFPFQTLYRKFRIVSNPCEFYFPNLLVRINFKNDVKICGSSYSRVEYICDLRNNECCATFYSEKENQKLYPASLETVERYLKVVSCPEEMLSDTEKEERREIAEPFGILNSGNKMFGEYKRVKELRDLTVVPYDGFKLFEFAEPIEHDGKLYNEAVSIESPRSANVILMKSGEKGGCNLDKMPIEEWEEICRAHHAKRTNEPLKK